MSEAVVTAKDFASDARRRRYSGLLTALIAASIAGGGFVAFGLDSPVLPLIVVIAIGLPVLLWHQPRAVLYLVFTATCLIELFPTGYSDALTDRVPFFWNVNTIFQNYAHADVKAVPLNLLEVLLLVAGAISLLRAVYREGRISLRGGPLLVPILVYIAFVLVAWGNGMATGGDFKLALQEVRAQIYFLVAYLMAMNLVRSRREANALLVITAACAALKALLYVFRRYVTLHGQPLPDQGVGSHEEAFFFSEYFLLLAALALCRTHPRLRAWMLWALPLVVVGDMVTNRRAGIAAVLIAAPIVLFGAWRGFPARRRGILCGALVAALAFAVYYPLYRNSTGTLALPARAIHSEFEPDARDASSNEYRDAENADQMATIRSAPLGYGYGKRMLHAVPIADISDQYAWWDVLPHNQILWVWMRTGTLGFFAFWMMIAAILIRACRILRGNVEDGVDSETKTLALLTLGTIVQLLIFGLLDLQLSNFRDMLYAGIWTGVLAALPLQQSLPSSLSSPSPQPSPSSISPSPVSEVRP